MDPIFGWAVHERQPSVAHEVFSGEPDHTGRCTYWATCGALKDLEGDDRGWELAGAGVERCRACSAEMALAPDVD